MAAEKPNQTYREFMNLAAEAQTSADKAKDPQAKISFEKLAAGWKHLAEQILSISNRLNRP
jgi:hypothetical protein